MPADMESLQRDGWESVDVMNAPDVDVYTQLSDYTRDLLSQARGEEPEPPSRAQPHMPSDLGTALVVADGGGAGTGSPQRGRARTSSAASLAGTSKAMVAAPSASGPSAARTEPPKQFESFLERRDAYMKRAEAKKAAIRREMTPAFQPKLVTTNYEFKQPTAESILGEVDLGAEEADAPQGQGDGPRHESKRERRQAQRQPGIPVSRPLPKGSAADAGRDVTRGTYSAPNQVIYRLPSIITDDPLRLWFASRPPLSSRPYCPATPPHHRILTFYASAWSRPYCKRRPHGHNGPMAKQRNRPTRRRRPSTSTSFGR